MARGLVENFPESAVMVVQVKEVSFVIIVSGIDVGPSVVIDIADGDAQTEIQAAAIDVGGFAYVGEMTVVIPVEAVAELRVAFGPQLIGVVKGVIEHGGVVDHEQVEVA